MECLFQTLLPLGTVRQNSSSKISEIPSSRTQSLQNSAFFGLSCHASTSQLSRSSPNPLPSQAKKCKSGKGSLVVSASVTLAELPSLNDIPLTTYINNQGRIIPPVEAGTQASVFAVFDANKKIQYVGFSKDVRNSLRTLMGRRAELCYFYKIYNLKELDQKVMVDIRKHWFSEMGLPPAGNTEAYQRDQWEKPADAGSISERGKVAAASSKAKTMLQNMKDRGLKEEGLIFEGICATETIQVAEITPRVRSGWVQMVYDPALIEQGKCDVLPSKGLSAAEQATAAEENRASASKMRHVALTSPCGEAVEFDIVFQNKIVTNGGWMFDLKIAKDDRETRHRVVCSRMYPEATGLTEEEMIERTFAFLLHKKQPRQTEGVLRIDEFAVNYFAISELAQKFDEFQEWFTGQLPDAYWRFNRIHSYGNETAPLYTERPLLPQFTGEVVEKER